MLIRACDLRWREPSRTPLGSQGQAEINRQLVLLVFLQDCLESQAYISAGALAANKEGAPGSRMQQPQPLGPTAVGYVPKAPPGRVPSLPLLLPQNREWDCLNLLGMLLLNNTLWGA